MNQTELTTLLLTEGATWEYDGKFHILGGKGSGHFGHAGIPGHRGGSVPKGGGVGQAPVRYPPGTKMPDNPPVMETRPFLFFGSPVTKYIRATEEEQKLISEAFESLNIPGYVGRHPEVWLSIDTRKGEQLGLTSGRTTYVNPKIIHDRELLRSTIAHEVSHIVLRNAPGNKIEKRFEGAFGKGPYPKGRLGIDSVYHLQNSSEMLSKLFANHLIGKEVPMSVQGFIGWEFYQGQPWGEIKLSEPSLHLAERATWEYISGAHGKFHILGGKGSGHFGHAGRPGKRGGSASKGSSSLGATIEASIAENNKEVQPWEIGHGVSAGWVAPSGKIYAVPWERHRSVAIEAVLPLKLPREDQIVTLEREGFSRVATQHGATFVDVDLKWTPRAVFKTLRDIISVNDPNQVVFDIRRGRESVSNGFGADNLYKALRSLGSTLLSEPALFPDPSLHLALSEHPTIDSYISYLIEEDYHFRTNGQQVVVLEE